MIAGGNWNNGSNAGVFNVNLNNNRTNSNNNVGFACDCNTSNSDHLRQWNYRDWIFLHYAKSTDRGFLVGPKGLEDQPRQKGKNMKRVGFLFEKAFTKESLYLAYLEARKGKRKKYYCFRFETNLGDNLDALYQELHAGTYKPRPYQTFVIKEPKPRVIHAPAFRDMVVQHAIYRVIYPIFDKTFIDQSYACRVGKGTHKASEYAQKCLRQSDSDSYTLTLDIKKFFYSIKRWILRRLIERKIKDTRFVDLMMTFAKMDTKYGIPIGNLLSQVYALIVMNPVDHFVKRVLKVRKYFRYVDDFVLVGIDRAQCLEYRKKIVAFLKKNLALGLSKSTIQKVKHGLNFVGYCTWKNKKFIRKYSLYKFRKCVRKKRMHSVVSLLGHAKYTNSLPYMFQILKEIGNDIKIPESFRKIRGRIINHASAA